MRSGASERTSPEATRATRFGSDNGSSVTSGSARTEGKVSDSAAATLDGARLDLDQAARVQLLSGAL